MKKLLTYKHYWLIVGLALALFLIGQTAGGPDAWAGTQPFQTIPTMKPSATPDDGGGDDGGGGNDDPTNTPVPAVNGAIVGTVVDLSTGLAGSGIVVQINNFNVTTDAFGDYALEDLSAGEYVVSLALNEPAVPAQDPVPVYVDGFNEVVVNLEFYSSPPTEPQPTNTATETPAVTPTETPISGVTATPTETSAAALPTPEDTPAMETPTATNTSLPEPTATETGAPATETPTQMPPSATPTDNVPTSTLTPVATVTPITAPQTETSAGLWPGWWVILGAGVLLLGAGAWFSIRHKSTNN